MTVGSFRGDLLAPAASLSAALRAIENERRDRLFEDSLAYRLAGEEGNFWLKSQNISDEQLQLAETVAAIRTRYFDDVLLRCAREMRRAQVVILAAGFDARAYRLAWPRGTHLYEIDQLDVLTHKDSILSAANARARCTRTPVPADLTSVWLPQLKESGFDDGRSTLWLIEGFLAYLPQKAAWHVLASVSNAASAGDILAIDLLNTPMLHADQSGESKELLTNIGAPLRFAVDDPVALLDGFNWSAQIVQLGEEGANFGRWPDIPSAFSAQPDVPRTYFVTARRNG